MSVLTDLATHGILNSELTNCPRSAAELGELQRVDLETVSSRNLANAIGNMNRTRIDATRNRLRLKDGERLYPKSWSGSTPLGGFAREVAAWLGYIDPTHEPGKLIQQTTRKGRSERPRTDGRHAVDDKCAELDCELPVALANVTGGAARSTVLKVTQVEPSRGFATWQALVDGSAPRSSNDPAPQPVLATPKRWSLKVAEYGHQLKVTNGAQKTFVVREMMPKDIKREFLTGPGKLEEIMEKLEIIINENDGRLRTSTNGSGECWHARCENDAV